VWLLHLTCKEYRLNPADEMGLRHPWVRWQFNHAVAALGRHVQNMLDEKKANGKPKYSIEEALGLPVENKPLKLM
jgi:hypothetical protein